MGQCNDLPVGVTAAEVTNVTKAEADTTAEAVTTAETTGGMTADTTADTTGGMTDGTTAGATPTRRCMCQREKEV